jgi:hypothetical protein
VLGGGLLEIRSGPPATPSSALTFFLCPTQMPYLGMRKRDDKGKLGAYQWMTYAQVSPRAREGVEAIQNHARSGVDFT